MMRVNRDEELAFSFFKRQGYKTVTPHPLGRSRPPDLLIDYKIAVEVRRLNQHEPISKSSPKPRGLEEVDISFSQGMRRLLPSLGPPKPISWYVCLEFSRPVPSWKEVRPLVKQRLKEFQDIATRNRTTIRVVPNFAIELRPAAEPRAHCFVMGGSIDDDSGGFVISELERNIRICVEEKTAKVARIKSKYPEWWLVLVDHINYSLDGAIQVDPQNWDKILLLDPLAGSRAVEVGRPHGSNM